MKALVPVLIAILGLGAGIGAGLALKPAPEPEAGAAAACPENAEHACDAAAADPFKPAPHGENKPEGEPAYVPMDKPFVVPVFAQEKVIAMVVVSLSVETDLEGAHMLEAAKPRLRDSFLKIMFRHANSGGFNGSFTSGQKLEDLKSALLQAAREVNTAAPISEVLITEIARQDT